MKVTERRSSPRPLDVGPLRTSAPSAGRDDTPFGAAVGAVIGVAIGGLLWALIGWAILLLRR